MYGFIYILSTIQHKINLQPALRFAAVLPDFAQVYSFIGSVFDPETTGHLHKLKKMDPIDVETVCAIKKFDTIASACYYQLKFVINKFIIYLFTGTIVDEKFVHQSYKPRLWGSCKRHLLLLHFPFS